MALGRKKASKASAKKASAARQIDITRSVRAFTSQFRELDTRDPSSWPVVPRSLLLVLVAAVVVAAAWMMVLKNVNEDLESARNKEGNLKSEYLKKLQKAVSLDALKQQREQVLQYVTLLEKQLPDKAEMDALLSDINQAGLGRSLQFELFKPGQLIVRDYYAELPIALRVTGRYHDIGEFTADIANLSRIVTLNELQIQPGQKGGGIGGGDMLILNATAKTFRYLDPEEVAAQARAKKGKK